eukprot:scaffold68432_cov61-Phaeocystis_antarctica.AAC.3
MHAHKKPPTHTPDKPHRRSRTGIARQADHILYLLTYSLAHHRDNDQSTVRRTHRTLASLCMSVHLCMARAWLRHQSALPAAAAFCAGASHSAAARSECVAASKSSAAERGPASQPLDCPLSTSVRMLLADISFGADLTTLADGALSPSSFHHSGLGTSSHPS